MSALQTIAAGQLGWRFAVVQRVVGVLLMLFSLTMLTPVPFALYFGDGNEIVLAFAVATAITVAVGAAAYYPVRRVRAELKLRDGFLVVVAFWTVLGLFGAIPLALGLPDRLTIAQAVFESVSGLTTTGATVLIGLDQLPRGILFYRQQLQWLGGIGIVVLAVAILPMLGVGGMQLYRAETPGPVKDDKLTPRIRETARLLSAIYLLLTVVCALCYLFAGMEWFDAIGHAFSTVATGGFSTHDASIGYYNSTAIELIAVIFMFLASTNFSLHFLVWRQRSLRVYLHDPEWRVYAAGLAAMSIVIALVLYYTGTAGNFTDAATDALFQAVSIATTTGFTTAEYANWPLFLPVLLLISAFIGGCAHSAAGGMKVVRAMLLYKQGMREVYRLIHPNAVVPVRLGDKVLPEPVVEGVWGFFSVFVGCYVIMLLLLLCTGLDPLSAFAAVAATINNLGPGLGEVASNFATVSETVLWVCTVAMLLGRLELFPLLVVLTPAFWRR